jgi:hypothetical protein
MACDIRCVDVFRLRIIDVNLFLFDRGIDLTGALLGWKRLDLMLVNGELLPFQVLCNRRSSGFGLKG